MPSRPIRTALIASCAVLALAACREDERTASAAVGYGVAPSALAYDVALAPDGAALPDTAPAPVGRLVSDDDGYAWAERAYAMDRAFYDVPPDYGFAYDEVEPWVWESEDRWAMYAEPVSEGYRYYYYEPGQEHPYFVRDRDYGYGYDGAGRLVTLYSAAGALLPVSYLNRRADMAGRYWNRAHDLRRAGGRERRDRIAQDRWLARQPVFERSQRPWMEAAVRRDDWRAYRVRQDQRDVRRFEPERQRREAVVERLNRDELRRAERGWRDQPRQVALAPQEDRRWRWGGGDDDRRGGPDRDRGEREARRPQMAQVQANRGRQDAERRDLGRVEQEARSQQMVRAEGERRGREEMRARQDQRRQQLAQVEGERRGRQEAQERDRRGRDQAQQAQRRQQMAQAQNERRGREQSQAQQAQQEQRRQQMAQAQNERRGRQETQNREREGRQQQVRAEGERRGREEMAARQAQRQQQISKVENERRGRQEAQNREREGRQQQARAEGERRGREQAQAQQQVRQEARNAGQAGRDAGGRERADRGERRGGRRED